MKIRRWLCLLCAVMLLYSQAVVVRAQDPISWNIDEAGTLTVTGSGDMPAWSSASAVPWYTVRSSIKAVQIGQGITSIGKYAFYNCTNLTTVTIADSVITVGRNAFQNCRKLTSVTIPDNVTDIGMAAFYNCTGLAELTLGQGVVAIGDEAFFGCSSLTQVYLPALVSELGLYAFAECSNLTAFRVAEENRLFSADAAGCLFDKQKTALYQAPTTISGGYAVPETVETICEDAFYGCENLVALTIPSSVTAIESYAFDGCTGVTHITFAGAEQRWDMIAIGENNTAVLTAETKHFEAAASTVYYTENCVSSGLYCSLCKAYVVQNDKGGSHSYADAQAAACQNCSYVRTLTKISLAQKPDVTEYENGIGTLDTTGGLLQLSYDDGSSETMEFTPAMVSGFDNNTLGTQTLTVTYQGKTTTYQVTVILRTPDRLTLVTLPDQCSYVVGQQLDLTGLTLQAHYEGQQAIPVTPEQLLVEPVDMTTAGKKTVTVGLKGISLSFEILVHNTAQVIAPADTYPESVHNYASNTNETKTFSYPGAVSLTLTFDDISQVENNFDFLYVYDGQDNLLATYTGKLYNQQLTVTGETFKVQLVSDASSNRYGYAFSSIVATVPVHSYDQNYCIVCDQRQYALAIYQDGQIVGGGQTLEQTLAAYTGAGQYIRLFTNVTSEATLTTDLYVDLNGYDLTGTLQTNGFCLYGMDSTTDGYTCENTGYFSCVDEAGAAVVPVTYFKLDSKRYMAISESEGYSFHRFYLGITHQTLRPNTDGVGFKGVFYGDSLVQGAVAQYGYDLTLGNFDTRSVRKTGSFVSGKTVRLRIDHFDATNFGTTQLNAAVVLVLKDGTQIASTECTMTLRGLLELLNERYLSLSAQQLQDVAAYVERNPVTKTWETENLYQ